VAELRLLINPKLALWASPIKSDHVMYNLSRSPAQKTRNRSHISRAEVFR
jgi:hypothetical protein